MFKTKDEIENWLNKNSISQYTIKDDLTVDVNNNINLHHRDLVQLPVQFGIVNGNFWAFSNKLTTLKGVPYEVTGTFHCALNQLTSLENCPKIIGKSFNCLMNPLTSLKGFNSIIEGEFMH